MNLSPPVMEALILERPAVDAANGGLIIGPTHGEGGIQMFMRTGQTYMHVGEVEGFEYILNPGASAYYQKKFQQINNAQRDQEGTEDFEIDYPGHVIDCRSADAKKLVPGLAAKIIVLNSITQLSIINKFSTIKHLQELTAMNQWVSFKYNHTDFTQATALEVVRVDTAETLNTLQIVLSK